MNEILLQWTVIEYLVLFLLLAYLAEIIGTMSGFGSSLLFVPIAGLFFDFYSVLGITALFHVSSNLTKIFLFRKGFDRPLLIYLGIPSVLFVVAGSFLSRYTDGRILQIITSLFLVITSILFLLKQEIVFQPTKKNAIAGGIFSGFAAGLLGSGGAIRGLTLASFNLPKDIFIATSAMIDLGVDSARSVVYYTSGYVHRHDLYLVPFLLLVSIGGTYTGKIILNKFSPEKFRTMVLVFTLLAGLVTLIAIISKD